MTFEVFDILLCQSVTVTTYAITRGYIQSFDRSVVLQRVVIVNLKSSRGSGLSWRLSRASSEGERSLVFNNKD